MLLADFSVSSLFEPIEVGVDESLHIVKIDYNNSLNYNVILILENNDGLNVKVKFPIDYEGSVLDYSLGSIISVKGVLKLDTEDLFYILVDEVLSYGISNNIYTSLKDEDDGAIEVNIQRNDSRVKQWHDTVIKRDEVCQCCGGEKHLEAHHIFSWEDYPDLRVDVNNGVALCKWCHHRYNSYCGHKGTGIGMVEYLNKFSGK